MPLRAALMGIVTRDMVRLRALDHARSVFRAADPDRAGAFEQTLDVLMREIVAHPNQDAAWSYSKLNSNGSPLEFTFTTLDDELRYTVEVGGPDLPASHRLSKAKSLLNELIAEGDIDPLVDEMRAIQHYADLKWGAWLGVRHQQGGTQHKLYCEVPASGSDLARASEAQYLSGCPLGLADRHPRLVAIGQTLGTARREFYYNLPGVGLKREELGALMTHVGLADREPDLWQLLRGDNPAEAQGTLPDIEFGVSYSALPGCGAPVFSAFCFAADYAGADALVRHRALMLTKQRGWSLGSYLGMTQPIARQTRRCAHHNVLAFITGPAPVIGMHVSLSPPMASTDGRCL